jgi:glycerol uptake facilitator-like aquaporin
MLKRHSPVPLRPDIRRFPVVIPAATAAVIPAAAAAPGRRAAAEFVGTGALTALVVGSGIRASSLSQDAGLQLLACTLASVLGLAVLLQVFGPLSGGHLNPVVTLTAWWSERTLPGREVTLYLAAQTSGAIAGTVLADSMFGRPPVAWSTQHRGSGPLLVSEALATAGLVFVIAALARTGRAAYGPVLVACYIGAAIWCTSSGACANPALSIGRAFTDTASGIAPSSLIGFLAAQLLGAGAGTLVAGLLFGAPPRTAPREPKVPGAPLVGAVTGSQ